MSIHLKAIGVERQLEVGVIIAGIFMFLSIPKGGQNTALSLPTQ